MSQAFNRFYRVSKISNSPITCMAKNSPNFFSFMTMIYNNCLSFQTYWAHSVRLIRNNIKIINRNTISFIKPIISSTSINSVPVCSRDNTRTYFAKRKDFMFFSSEIEIFYSFPFITFSTFFFPINNIFWSMCFYKCKASFVYSIDIVCRRFFSTSAFTKNMFMSSHRRIIPYAMVI